MVFQTLLKTNFDATFSALSIYFFEISRMVRFFRFCLMRDIYLYVYPYRYRALWTPKVPTAPYKHVCQIGGNSFFVKLPVSVVMNSMHNRSYSEIAGGRGELRRTEN